MLPVSGVGSSTKKHGFVDNQNDYTRKGKEYLEGARRKLQDEKFLSAQELFIKAEDAFKKIDPSKRNIEVDGYLAQAYLERGGLLQRMGIIEEARACYEAAKEFGPDAAFQRLQALNVPKTQSSLQKSTSQSVVVSSSSLGISISSQFDVLHFKHNPPPADTEHYEVVTDPNGIKNTHHLAQCLRTLKPSAAQELNKLAFNILEAFGKREPKNLDVWREVIPLAATPDPEKFRYLLGEVDKVLFKSLLDLSAFQSLAVMIHNLPEPLSKHSARDLVKLLQALTERLRNQHWESSIAQFQPLLQIISQVLDAMAKVGATSINRTQVQEPLDKILSELMKTPELRFQVYYARQALAHILNEGSGTSRWQEVWDRSVRVVLGAATLASAVRTLDQNELLEAFDHFSEVFSGAGQTVKRLAELADEMKDFGSSAREAGVVIRESLTRNRQNRWYAALQFLDTCLEEGQFVQFEQFARQGPYGRNEAFLLGLCQRLEQIARTQKDEVTQKAAIQFLGELVQNKSQQWGQYDRVQQAVHHVLGRLAKAKTLPGIQAQAKTLLEQLPLTGQQAETESEVDYYIAPMWDPAWQQVGTQLLYEARGADRPLTELKNVELQGNRATLSPLGLEKEIQVLKDKYAKELEEIDEVKEALAMYVEPQGKLTVGSSEGFDLEAKVTKFLASDKKVLLLLGEEGSGKSTFNRHLARRLWDDYNKAESSQECPIPLFIPLSTLKNSGENLIAEYLKEQGLSAAQIEALRMSRRFIFILDSYDEIVPRSRAFYLDNGLDRWQARVIISSRPEYLGSNYQYIFHPSGERTAFQEYQLAPFSGKTIEQYVDQYKKAHPEGSWSAEQYKEALKQGGLKELVGNPFLLKIMLSVLPELSKVLKEKDQHFTRLALYDQFVKSWFERSRDRLRRIQLKEDERKAFNRLSEEGFGEHSVAFSKRFSVAMYQAQKVAVTYSAANRSESQNWEPFLGSDNEETRLLRFNAPLSRQGNQYRFIHKSLQDYFVARALWEELDVHNSIDRSSCFNRLNIVNDPAVLQFLSERVQQEGELKERLLWLVNRTKEESEFAMGSANAMTVLVRAGVQFNGMDLKGIRIPGADLSNGVFDSAKLQRADLTNVNLCNSWLRGANLDGAQMGGVKFGEWPLLQEESEVFCCAYSPDGETFASGLKNCGISVYKTSNWEKLWTLQAHSEAVTKVVYSPKKGQLASSSWDKTVRLWDLTTGAALQILSDHNDAVYGIAYSPSGDQLASGSGDAKVRIWDVETGALLCTLSGHSNLVSSVAYSPKERQLASGCYDKTVRIWDVETGVMLQTLSGHSKEVNKIAYSPRGVQLASGSADGTVRLWDVETGTCQYTFNLSGHGDSIWSIAYSPCGTQLASGSGTGIVYLLDVETSTCQQILRGHLKGVDGVMYSPNGAQLASGSIDKTVRLWDVKIGSFNAPSNNSHNSFVHSVEYSLDGNQIASGSSDYTIRLWDMATGTCRHTFIGHTDEVRSLAYSPKSEQLASGGFDKTVRLWDIETGAIRHTLKGHTDWIISVAYSPTGDQIASGSQDTTVRLWDAETGVICHILRGHKGLVTSVTYSPDGAQLASSNEDKTIRLWDAKSGIFIRDLIGHTAPVNSVMYSLDGAQLASGGDDHTIRLWDLETAAYSLILSGHCDEVWDVKYSPDGTQLVSGSKDHTVRLWDAKTGLCQMVLQSFNGPVASVAWKMISNSLYLATGSHDHSVRQWQIIREEVRYKAILCWSSENIMLTAFEMSIQGVQGLSQLNQKLLEQRGAVGIYGEKSE